MRMIEAPRSELLIPLSSGNSRQIFNLFFRYSRKMTYLIDFLVKVTYVQGDSIQFTGLESFIQMEVIVSLWAWFDEIWNPTTCDTDRILNKLLPIGFIALSNIL